MSVVTLCGESEGLECACLVCNTTDWVFGPLIRPQGEYSAEEVAEQFRDWLPKDPREYEDNELEGKYYDFQVERYPDG